MTTARDLVATAKRHLLADSREQLNKLASSAIVDATSLVLTYDVAQIAAGSTVEVGMEVFHVWAVNAGTKTLTVEPAQLGSTSTTHDAGDLVTVKPRFPTHTVLAEINNDLQALSSPTNGLYLDAVVELTYSSSAGGYDLTGVTDVDGILDIHAEPYSTTEPWRPVTNWTVSRDAKPSLFPSGFALFLYENANQGKALRVRYRKSFSPLTALSQDVLAITGLPTSCHDIPPLGAAARLAGARDIKRNFVESQGDSRRAEEVGSGAILRSAAWLQSERQRRIVEEASRLSAENPIRSFIPQPVVTW